MPNAIAEKAASQALALLTTGIGPAGSVVYGDQRLSIQWSSLTLDSLARKLETLGAVISASITLPARRHGQTIEHVMGMIADAQFTGTVTLRTGDTRSLEILIYTAAMDGENDRLLPAMDMVHTILTAAGRADQTLAAYVARQLQTDSPENARVLAASLASTLADHLAAQLPLANAAALRAAADNRRP